MTPLVTVQAPWKAVHDRNEPGSETRVKSSENSWARETDATPAAQKKSTNSLFITLLFNFPAAMQQIAAAITILRNSLYSSRNPRCADTFEYGNACPSNYGVERSGGLLIVAEKRKVEA
jgi:hypothetical protein